MLPRAESVVRHIREHPGCPTRELARHFGVGDEEFDDFVKALFDLQAEGEIVRLPRAGWELPARTDFRVGTLQLDRRGKSGFVRVAAGSTKEDDIFVRGANLRDAFPGDTVLVSISQPARQGLLREGRVVDVVERSRHLVRGIYHSAKRAGFVTPVALKRPVDIQIPAAESAGARDGERVLVRLLDGAGHGEHPRGQVVARVEDDGSLDTDLQVICAEFGLPVAHAPQVLQAAKEAEAIREGASWPGRLDLRDALVFTIDPVDARDFDDAISLEHLPTGDLRLGVHIADVSYYVPAGSALDLAARGRGTSVYLPGHVLHMLPERLANDLCSLRPGEDRLTKTVRLTFSSAGLLKKTEIMHSVIRSRRRFTYKEVLSILELLETGKATANLPPDHADFEDVLRSMAHLRDKLHRDRHHRGALYLDIPKLRLHLDERGAVSGLGREERDPSHALIEEFMLAANEAVAAYFIEKRLPLVARVHPPPEEKRLEDLRVLLSVLDIRLGTKVGSRELQKLVEKVSGDPLSPLIQLALLRTMGHAAYVFGAGLHFALATSAYCHFTSPIRRYPDLLVHQALAEHLDGRLQRATRRQEWNVRLPGVTEEASEQERRAEEAEREMMRLRLIRFLKPQVGEEMNGWVVSVHPFGFFVRIDETLVEGLVHVSTLDDDYYEFDPEKLRLIGQRRHRQFSLGEKVRVELMDVDADLREISFRFVKRLGGQR